MAKSRSESDSRSQSSALEGLRKQAKRWLRALRDPDGEGHADALARLERVLPRHGDPPVLREVQQALAREQAFSSWAELKEHHELDAGEDLVALADVFLEHACIFTKPVDLPVKHRRAERILARHPELAAHSIHTAVVCGELDAVRATLAADPRSIEAPGGPQQWVPLLFACFGRIERARETGLEMIRLLLDAGADPNAFFASDDDWRLRFTALTGVMGQGEMGQPEHPHAEDAARLLLSRGANANDGQGLYDTSLVGDDPRWLELLGAHGLSADDAVNVHVDPADARHSGLDSSWRQLDYLLGLAATNGHLRRLRWLLEHGADPNATSLYDGKPVATHARRRGDAEAVALLERHGARVETLAGHDAFVAAARAGRREEASAMLAADPSLREDPEPLLQAASAGDLETISLLLDLGLDPNREGQHGHRALHNASSDRACAERLLEGGADPRLRVFGGTPSGWARHAGNADMAGFLAEASRSLLDAVACGHVTLVRELLESDPGCIQERSPDGSGPFHEVTADVALAEPILAMLLAKGADPLLENDAGETPGQRLEANGADETADLLEVMREE